MHNRSPEFKKLQRKWYSKIAKKGFEDIEKDGDLLKEYHAYYIHAQYEETKDTAKAEYYRLAGGFLYTHKFKDQKSRAIWELHADGVSIRDIEKKLKSRKFKTYRDEIDHIIRDLAEIMLGRKKSK